MTITEFIEAAAHNKIIQLVVLAIVCDTVFGVLRAIKEKKFNSCAGIDGAIRKVGMLPVKIALSVQASYAAVPCLGLILQSRPYSVCTPLRPARA